MTEVELPAAEVKQEEEKDEDESVYSDPNGKYRDFLLFQSMVAQTIIICSCRYRFLSESIRNDGISR